jgi:hypothetical protein
MPVERSRRDELVMATLRGQSKVQARLSDVHYGHGMARETSLGFSPRGTR